MAVPTFTADQGQLLLMIWEHFKRQRTWPLKRDLLLKLLEDDKDLDAVVSDCRGISVDRTQEAEVRASFDALLTIPDVRTLLEPLPVLVRLAASRFIEHPGLTPNVRAPTVGLADMTEIWGDTEIAKLVGDLLIASSYSILRYAGGMPGEINLSAWYEVLHYEKAQTLDDLLVQPHRPVKAGSVLEGPHLELVQRVFTHLRTEHRWPVPGLFAVKHRDLAATRPPR